MKIVLAFVAFICATTTANLNGVTLSAFLTNLKQAMKSTIEESDNMECKQPVENLLDMVQQFEMEQSTKVNKSCK